MSLLEALHDQERTLEVPFTLQLNKSDDSFQLVHFCVGPYNTVQDKNGKNQAILIGNMVFCEQLISLFAGIAIDLRTQKIFPASYPWNNFEDFSAQLQDRFLRYSLFSLIGLH